jgi:putative transposase
MSADRGQRADLSSLVQGVWRPEDGSGAANGTVGGRKANDLEKENQRLRRAIYEPTLDKLILQEAARGTF